jgi:hypothetical protein
VSLRRLPAQLRKLARFRPAWAIWLGIFALTLVVLGNNSSARPGPAVSGLAAAPHGCAGLVTAERQLSEDLPGLRPPAPSAARSFASSTTGARTSIRA